MGDGACDVQSPDCNEGTAKGAGQRVTKTKQVQK